MQPSPALVNSAVWRQRWYKKLADRERPVTPTQPEVPKPASPPPDLYADCKNEKFATLKAEGVYQPTLNCPGCRTAEHVFDDPKQGRTVCRGCGLVLREMLIKWEPEIEWDNTKDKDDRARLKQAMIDNDPQFKPWIPPLQTMIGNGKRAGGGAYGNVAQTHAAMVSKQQSVEDLIYAHSGAADEERLALLARRTAELKLWHQVRQMDADKARTRCEFLQEWLHRHNHPKPKPDDIPQLQLELDVLLAAHDKTPTEIERQIAAVQRAVEFLTVSQAEHGMTIERKQELHAEIAFRRFAKSAEHLHEVVAALFDPVPLKLLDVAQDMLKRFVGLHDKRLNSRDTWACCCIQLAAMYHFQFMLNERALRAYCSLPCKLKTLRKDIRIVRKALQLPPLAPAALVQLNRTHLQSPFTGLGRGRMADLAADVQFTEHPLNATEQSKLDVLFSVVLELVYAVIIPKPEPFKRKPAENAANVHSDSDGDGEGDGEDGSDLDEADDIANEAKQQAERANTMRQSFANAVGSKRQRSAFGESETKADMPTGKKQKAMPELQFVTQEQDSQTDAKAVWDFMRPVLAVLNKMQQAENKIQLPEAGFLAKAAASWPEPIKKQLLLGLQRRAPRTVASALFYLGVQSMRSASMRFTMDTVRIVAYVGAIPLRDCKVQLRDLMAFVLRQPNSSDLLMAAVAPYIATLNLKTSQSASASSSDSRAKMDISAPRLESPKSDLAGTFLRCP